MSPAVRSRRLRVAVLTPGYEPELGGIEKHVSEISRRLADTADIEVLAQCARELPGHEVRDSVAVKRFATALAGTPYPFAPGSGLTWQATGRATTWSTRMATTRCRRSARCSQPRPSCSLRTTTRPGIPDSRGLSTASTAHLGAGSLPRHTGRVCLGGGGDARAPRLRGTA